MPTELREVQHSGDLGPKPVRGIMACGVGGVGKTTLFGTLPGRKFCYCFDPHTAEQLLPGVDFVEFIPDATEIAAGAKSLKDASKQTAIDLDYGFKEPTSYTKYQEDLMTRLKEGFFDNYDWIGYDSGTTWSEMMMDRILYLAGRPGKHPEQADWTAEMNLMRSNLRQVARVARIYFAVHIEPRQDQLTKAVSDAIVLTGRNRLRIPLRFSNVVVLEAEATEVGKPSTHKMVVQKTRDYPYIRSTLPKQGLYGPLDVTINFNRSLEGQGLSRYFKL